MSIENREEIEQEITDLQVAVLEYDLEIAKMANENKPYFMVDALYEKISDAEKQIEILQLKLK